LLLVGPVVALAAGLAGVGLVAPPPAGAAPTILYVATAGSDTGNCQSSASPCATVSYALTQAGSGDTIEVSGTIVDHPSVSITVTIEQEPGGAPAVLDGGGTAQNVVFMTSTANLTLDQVTVEDSNGGGGILDESGTLSVVDSTIADNTSGTAGSSPGLGGGIDMDGGTLNVEQSTFADNTAISVTGLGPGFGGAILVDNAAATITDSTFVDNSSQGGLGDGIEFDNGSKTRVLAGDILGHVGAPVAGAHQCSGDTPTDAGYNVSDDSSCGFTGTGSVNDSATLDSFLSPLAANGGPTQTVALLPGSGATPDPAQAVIPASFVAPGQSTPVCSQPDQRGQSRGVPCDMGAYALTTASADGYWLAAADGGVFAYGDVGFYGSMGGKPLNAPIVGIASTPDHDGYWLVASDGGVFAFGDAGFYGSMGGKHLNAPIVGMTETSDGGGYWLAAADGGVFAFGDAAFEGSAATQHLTAPVVHIDRAAHGTGYYLVAADGGVFAFGGATFYGSHGGSALSAPVVGMTKTSDDGGYWLADADGAVFPYGDAVLYGSAATTALRAPIVGIKVSPGGSGYWLVGADGGIFAYGDAPFFGSHGGSPLNAPVVGMA
jgi:hypothetical protein